MKKTLLYAFSALSLISNPGFAQVEAIVVETPIPAAPPESCPKAFQGFYLGANIGYGLGIATSKIHGVVNAVVGGIPATQAYKLKNHPGIRGIDGGLSVGYLHRFNNFALGLDFTANWVDSKASGKKIVTSTIGAGGGAGSITNLNAYNTRLENSLQLAAKFGWVIDKTLPFFKLGWDNSRWKQSDRLTGTNSDFHGTKRKRINGFLWGVGVDFLMTKNITMGLEYTGTITGNTTMIKSPPVTYSWKPQYNKFAITAKYIFN